MATGDVIFPRQVVLQGTFGVVTRQFGPFNNIPAALGYVMMDIDMTNSTQAGQDIGFSVQISPDGGATWPYTITGFFAGEPPGPRAVLPLISKDTFLIPDAGNPNRQVKGTLNITGAPRAITVGLTGLSA